MALVERADSNKTVTISINRPEKLNALSRELISALTDEFKKVSSDVAAAMDIRCLILRSSTPKAFCVGADLSERLAMNEKQVVEALDSLQQMTLALENIVIPTIAVIQGGAFGGGLELALCCDLRVAHPAAVMGLTETRLAIIPGAGGTQRLTQLVGVAKAKEWILLGTRFNATEALSRGLINAVGEDPEAIAAGWTQEFSERGPLALKAAKSAINRSLAGRVSPESLAIERACYQKVLHSKDRVEGLKAFVEKREPQYRGE